MSFSCRVSHSLHFVHFNPVLLFNTSVPFYIVSLNWWLDLGAQLNSGVNFFDKAVP